MFVYSSADDTLRKMPAGEATAFVDSMMTQSLATTVDVHSSRERVRVWVVGSHEYGTDYPAARGDVRAYIAACVADAIAEQAEVGANYARHKAKFFSMPTNFYPEPLGDRGRGIGWARNGYTLGAVTPDYRARGAYRVAVWIPKDRDAVCICHVSSDVTAHAARCDRG